MNRRFQFSLKTPMVMALFFAVEAAILPLVFPSQKDVPFFIGFVGTSSLPLDDQGSLSVPRPQFSIRTLFWLTLVGAAFLGGISLERARALISN